jgi:hypothetical protein
MTEMSTIECLLMDVSSSWKESKPMILGHLEKDDKEIIARILYDALIDSKELKEIKENMRNFYVDLVLIDRDANTNVFYNQSIHSEMCQKPDMKKFKEDLMKEHGYDK